MQLIAEDWWTLATCIVCATACALLGVFLVLKRLSLMGDALSHAVLPGLALAFIVTGTREIGPMMIGALLAAVMAGVISSFLHRNLSLTEDSSLGVVFTTFFALGVILISLVARSVDFDPGCVLYGAVEYVPFNTIDVGGFEIPRGFAVLSTVFVLNLLFVSLFLKQLVIGTFDPGYSQVIGLPSTTIHLLLLTLVAATAVAAFEVVGSVLVVAMLIAPAAAASLVARSVLGMIVSALAFGVLAATTGYFSALAIDTSVAGMMSVAAGSIFFLAFVFAPQRGEVWQATRRAVIRYQILKDDVLGFLYRWHELHQRKQSDKMLPRISDVKAGLHSRLGSTIALADLVRKGLLIRAGDSLSLTESGLTEGAKLIRSHRLWESYLAKKLGIPLDHVHEPSERTEHYIGRELAQELAVELKQEKDPHGKPIP